MTILSENERQRLFEVPFTYEITGTLLVIAEDDAKARAKVQGQMTPDLDSVHENDVLFLEDDVVLKDELKGMLTIENPSRAANPHDYADRFDADEFELLGNTDEAQPEPYEEKQGENKPFDENNDGIDKPGDDRHQGRTPSSQPRPQSGPAIGMTGTRDANPPTAPQSNAPRGGETQEQRKQATGEPTTANTSAGAVNPNVNRLQPTPPPAGTIHRPGVQPSTAKPAPTVSPRPIGQSTTKKPT